MKIQKSKWIYVSAIIVFLFVSTWSYLTPLMGDDLASGRLNLSQIIPETVHEYLTWNGRFWGQLIVRLLVHFNGLTTALLNGFVFTLMVLLVNALSTKNTLEKVSVTKFIALTIACFVFIPVFNETILWRAGSGNYLWLNTLVLLTIWVVKKTTLLTKNKASKSTYANSIFSDSFYCWMVK